MLLLLFLGPALGETAVNGDGSAIIPDTNLRLLLLSRLVLMESDGARLNLDQRKL